MKTIRLSYLALITLLVTTASCQKDAQINAVSGNEPPATPAVSATSATSGSSLSARETSSGPCNSNAYTVLLESRTLVNGAWEWVWSVQNPNPGNGSNGTVQNLSHWGMQLGACVSWASVVGAANSADGVTWTSFTPVYQSDPSQSCMTTPTLKFDFGTSGSSKSYYKLVLNADYQVVAAPAYYKSGANTGFCTFSFAGVGCIDGDGPR